MQFSPMVKFGALHSALRVIFQGFSKNTIWHCGFGAQT